MAYSSGQHTYEEKGEEQNRWQNTFSLGRCIYKECSGTSGKAPYRLAVCVWRRQILLWHICWGQKIHKSQQLNAFCVGKGPPQGCCHTMSLPQQLWGLICPHPSAPVGKDPLCSGWVPRWAASFLHTLVVLFKPKVISMLLRTAGGTEPTNMADNSDPHYQWVSNLVAYLGALKRPRRLGPHI